MNLSQRILLALAALALAVMTLYPPWIFVFQPPGSPRIERFAGYYPIWQSNAPTDLAALKDLFNVPANVNTPLMFFSIEVDKTRLGVQILAALLVTILLAVLLRASAVRGDS